MNSQWSNNLRKRIEAHEEPVPEGLWEDIEQVMNEAGSVRKLSKPKKIILWTKRIGTVAALIIIILLIGINRTEYTSNKSQSAKQEPDKQEESEIINLFDKTDDLFANNASIPTEKNDTHSPSTEIPIYQNNTQIEISKAQCKNSKKGVKKQQKEKNIKINEEKGDSQSASESESQFNYQGNYDFKSSLPKNEKEKPGNWRTSIFASNISTGSTTKYEGYGSFISGNDEIEPVTDTGEDSYENILVNNENKEVNTGIKHKRPMTIGVSVNYILDEKWSITSGVSYIILSSELRSGSNEYFYKGEQTRHNIGIPLNINYSVWKSKKKVIYLSGGGLVEKNVSGTIRTDYIVNNTSKFTEETKISLERLQWSINSYAGIQYNIFKNIGLYAEPGVSYYFNNGSEIETIYKENPLNFSFRMGLRFSLNSDN